MFIIGKFYDGTLVFQEPVLRFDTHRGAVAWTEKIMQSNDHILECRIFEAVSVTRKVNQPFDTRALPRENLSGIPT